MKFTVSAILALSATVSAWSGPAHLMTARVAQEVLEKRNPEVITKVESILSILKDNGFPVREDKHAFTECVTFADDIKYHGGGWQASWHFIDQPYLDDKKDIADYPQYKADAHNITEAITGIKNWFNKEGDYDTSFMVQTIRKDQMKNYTSEPSEEIALSNAIRLMMHYLGDIHQPLHCVSRVDDKYPAGDRGGNSFPTKGHYKTKELHAVWDKVLYEFHVTEKVPITDDDWVNQGTIATRLIKENPESEIDPSMDPMVWAKESYEIASTFIYKGISEGDDLQKNTDYITKGTAFAEKRIATGGYRLAKLLESMTLGVTDEQIKFLTM